MTIKNYDYTTPANYTYDSDLIVIDGEASLVDIRPSGSISAGMWLDSSLDLSWGGGTLTATASGTAVVTDGELDLTGGGVHYVDYDATDNANSTQLGAFRFDVTPNYSNAPSTTQHFVSIGNASSTSKNVLAVFHQNTNAMYVGMTDQNSDNIIVAPMGTWLPTAGVTYTMELDFDITTGATRLFIDGTQQGNTLTQTGTRDSNIDLLRFGAYTGVGSGAADFKLDNFVYFTTTQHTANHVSELPFDEPCKYSNAAPNILTEKIYGTEITAFSDSFTQENGDTVKHTIVVDDVDYYVSGGMVVESSGTYAESSTSADINAYATSFLSERSGINVRSFLYSTGVSTPALDLTSITFDETLPPPTKPTSYSLQGFLYNIAEDSVKSGQIVQIRPYVKGFVNSGIFQIYEYETIATTDSDGWFAADVYLNPNKSNLYEIKIGTQSYYFDISDETGIIDLSDLTLTLVSND